MPMTRKYLIGWILGSLLVLVCSGLVSADRLLGSREAREALAKLTGTAYPTKQIRIRKVIPGFSSTDAIVEAEIEATFKFTRTQGQWQPTEIRIGDQQWQSLPELTAALAKAQRDHTEADLNLLATSLELYRAKQGGYVAATDVVQLTNVLAPEYLPRLVRRDGWNRQLMYQGTSNSFRLQSVGPDGKANTQDDVVIARP